MNRSSAIPARVRRYHRIWAGWLLRALAVAVMLLQVGLYADHLGARANAAAGVTVPGARMGMMELCTGEGAVSVPAGDRGAAAPCPVCSAAGIDGFSGCAPVVVPAVAWTTPIPQEAAPRATLIRAGTRIWRPGIRAPPARMA